jgi:hypothetical protein
VLIVTILLALGSVGLIAVALWSWPRGTEPAEGETERPAPVAKGKVPDWAPRKEADPRGMVRVEGTALHNKGMI